jgi:hypothetical protein
LASTVTSEQQEQVVQEIKQDQVVQITSFDTDHHLQASEHTDLLTSLIQQPFSPQYPVHSLPDFNIPLSSETVNYPFSFFFSLLYIIFLF